jgi:hypothetical protein
LEDSNKLKVYTINSKVTTKIIQQRVTANNSTKKKQENRIAMNCEQGITHTYWDYQKEKKEGKRRNV